MGVTLMCSQFKSKFMELKYRITANSWKDIDSQPVNLKRQVKGKNKSSFEVWASRLL